MGIKIKNGHPTVKQAAEAFKKVGQLMNSMGYKGRKILKEPAS